MANTVDGDLRVTGHLQFGGNLKPDLPRSNLELEQLAVYPVPLTAFRVWDAIQTLLPGTAAADDLGITGGTWATNAPKITTGDVKALGTTTRRARVELMLPQEYDSGEGVALRCSAGMTTTIADTSATVDFEVYKSDRDGTIGGSDLVSTAAQSMNSLTFANKTFTLDASGLSPGDILDVRMTVVVVDAATGTAVIADIGAVELQCDVRG